MLKSWKMITMRRSNDIVLKNKFSSKRLALHTQAVIQGNFILAKASGESQIVAESIDHLKNYIQLYLTNDPQRENHMNTNTFRLHRVFKAPTMRTKVQLCSR
jgi:hypothetical protein